MTITGPDHVSSVRIDMGDGPVVATTPVTDRLCATPPAAVSVPPKTHSYRAPGPYVVRAVATVYGCVFPHGPGVPMAVPHMGVAPTLVEAAVTYRHR